MRLGLILKALGLCALMAAFMAISAGAAQAAPEWMEATKNITGTTKSSPVEGKLENEEGKLLATINGLHLSVKCKKGTLENIQLTAGGSTTEGDVSFSSCEVFQVKEEKEIAVAGCEVRSEDQAVGSHKILSLPGRGQLGLHEGKPTTKIEPTSGIFAHLKFEEEESGSPCGALPLKELVGGTLVIEDCEGKAETEKEVHLIVEEKALSHLWLFNEEHPATLDGSALIKLANSANWSGLAG